MPCTVEGEPRPRAWLVEGIDQNLALQWRIEADVAAGIAFKLRRQPKQLQQCSRAVGVDGDHVLVNQLVECLPFFANP